MRSSYTSAMVPSTFVAVVILASTPTTTHAAQVAPPTDAGLSSTRSFVRRESPRTLDDSSSAIEALAENTKATIKTYKSNDEKERTNRTRAIRWVILQGKDLAGCDLDLGSFDPKSDHATKPGEWKDEHSFNYEHLHECEDFCAHEIECLGFIDAKTASPPYCTFKKYASAFMQAEITPHDSTNHDFWKIIPTWVMHSSKTMAGHNLQAMPRTGEVYGQVPETWAHSNDTYYYKGDTAKCKEFCRFDWNCAGFVDNKIANPPYCLFKGKFDANQVSNAGGFDLYTIKDGYTITYAKGGGHGETSYNPTHVAASSATVSGSISHSSHSH